MSDRRDIYRFGVETWGESGRLEYVGIKGRIILKFFFKEWNLEAWTGLNLFMMVKCGGYLYLL
jgi:hypothetical protein